MSGVRLLYGKEAMDLIRAHEAVTALVDHGQLAAEDRAIIEYSAIDLLSRIKDGNPKNIKDL